MFIDRFGAMELRDLRINRHSTLYLRNSTIAETKLIVISHFVTLRKLYLACRVYRCFALYRVDTRDLSSITSDIEFQDNLDTVCLESRYYWIQVEEMKRRFLK